MINKRIAALETKIATLETQVAYLQAKQPVTYVPYVPYQPQPYIYPVMWRGNTAGCAPAANFTWQVLST